MVLLNLFLRPWRWRQYVLPKHRLKLNGLYGVISQKMILFRKWWVWGILKFGFNMNYLTVSLYHLILNNSYVWQPARKILENLTTSSRGPVRACSSTPLYMERWMYSSIVLDLGARWRSVASFTPLYPLRKSTRYLLDRRLGGPQSRSGLCGEDENLTIVENRTPVVQPVDRRHTDWATLKHIEYI
jgi:hypothetical protein